MKSFAAFISQPEDSKKKKIRTDRQDRQTIDRRRRPKNETGKTRGFSSLTMGWGGGHDDMGNSDYCLSVNSTV